MVGCVVDEWLLGGGSSLARDRFVKRDTVGEKENCLQQYVIVIKFKLR